MTRHLLLISVGPVQDFIAEARRTRDLWFGSHALSELSRAAAKAIAKQDGTLIFPALEMGDLELEPCDEHVRDETKQPVLSIANKIQAVFEGKPEDVAKAARDAVKERWVDIATTVKSKVADCLGKDKDIDAIWNEQIETLIEFYAIWAPLDQDYKMTRDKVEQALAGRKNLRDFGQWTHPRKGAPKSSLDGARVSVLKEGKERTDKRFAQYRIPSGEQLSAVDLVKRAGFEPDQFVPIMNIAAVPWLVSLGGDCDNALEALGKECEQIGIKPIFSKPPVAKKFSHDASVFYPDRWASLFEELGKPRSDARTWGNEHVQKPILDELKKRKKPSNPSSYVACLLADGDQMGVAIDALAETGDGITAHQDFSRELSKFATRAREIVESETHLGSLVYAGGDDVLAFLSVEKAVYCAQALQKAFKSIMGTALKDKKTRDGQEIAIPTLSVGIGIGHVMEAMGTLLDLGREAEKAAKNAGRNALAIVLDKRSGGKRTWAASWDDHPAQILAKDVRLIGDELATGKIYEIGALLRRFDMEDKSLEASMLDTFVAGILAQSGRQKAGKKVTLADLTPLGGTGISVDFKTRREQLQKITDRLLIAKELRANGWRFAAAGNAP